MAERTRLSTPGLTRADQASLSPIFGAPATPDPWHFAHCVETMCSPLRCACAWASVGASTTHSVSVRIARPAARLAEFIASPWADPMRPRPPQLDVGQTWHHPPLRAGDESPLSYCGMRRM